MIIQRPFSAQAASITVLSTVVANVNTAFKISFHILILVGGSIDDIKVYQKQKTKKTSRL